MCNAFQHMFAYKREIARFRMDEITVKQQSMDMATSKGVSRRIRSSISNIASLSSVELQPHTRRTFKMT